MKSLWLLKRIKKYGYIKKSYFSGFTTYCINLHGNTEVEYFDNNFEVKDMYFIMDDACSSDTRATFKKFSKSVFLANFKISEDDLITTDNKDYGLFIKPYEISKSEIDYFTSRNIADFIKYRLLIFAFYPEIESKLCMLGFGVFPEAWDGNKWIRFESNKKIEENFLQKYIKEKRAF